MNFAPERPDRVLHDTWIYIHRDVVHLFYLAPQVGRQQHRLIGHAVSRNWLDWEERPFVELAGSLGAWDGGRVGTGHMFQYDDGRFYMAYTGRVDPREEIGLAVSDDLETWQKLSVDGPVWPRQLAPPYATLENAAGLAIPWRDPYIAKRGDGTWECFLCARVDDGPLAGRGCVARCRIEALDRWVTLPPMAATGEYSCMEVPEVFEFDGRCWLTFNTGPGFGRRIDTASRRDADGVFYQVAENWDGPWRTPEDSMLIGCGEGARGAKVARSADWRGERLVYYHHSGNMEPDSDRAFGLPKVLAADGDRLLLRPWPGLEGLWEDELPLDRWAAPEQGCLSGGAWRRAGARVRGACATAGAACLVEAEAKDIDLEVTVTIKSGDRAGVALTAEDRSVWTPTVLLDARRNEITIGRMDHAYAGPRLDPFIDRCFTPVHTARPYRLRLLARDRYAEVFVDDVLVFCVTVGAGALRGNGFACVVDNAEADFDLIRAHRLRPMQR